MRWYLLDLDVVDKSYAALCYEDDGLVEAAKFNDKDSAHDYGEQWIHSESINEAH